VSDTEIVDVNIPTGIPLVYELDSGLRPIRHYYLGDQPRRKREPGRLPTRPRREIDPDRGGASPCARPGFRPGRSGKARCSRTRIEGLRAKIAEAEEAARRRATSCVIPSARSPKPAARFALWRADARRRRKSSKTLLRRSQALETEIASRRESLGRLLTLRYLNGEQSAPKLLFSGEDPGRIARELHYYGYVSRAQAQFIGELRSSLARLKELENGTRERNTEIAAIESAGRAERAALINSRGSTAKCLRAFPAS